MYMELYNAGTDTGICFRCNQVDLVDHRVQLKKGGNFYFVHQNSDGDFWGMDTWWPHAGVSATHWQKFRLVSYEQIIPSLDEQK